MNSHDETIQKLFAQARELPKGERSQWLLANCHDPTIRGEVEQLLRYDIDDPFMEKPIVAPVDRDVTYSYRSPEPNSSKIFAGRYKLLQAIGEGGFGVVYMAEQFEPVRRRVAIKLLRSNMDSKSVLARFESERQALAMMDHPNIAKVFDGGVADDGTPYFVMELVNGVTITDFCDSNQLPNADRMKLLMSVCHAVQHAHQKGIIHRDLKPSNILVSLLDGKPIPKVIDFGIAKALHGPLTDKTLFTSFQQMIGTPEYMSPEQAETSILDVDTRSDVFSLGVLAYELLTGTTPFDGHSLRRLAFVEIQRTIREVDPPKPSDRVSTLGEQAASIAIKHGLNQSNMQKAIRGDLDWIVMKAMEKDRNRRYGSAQSLADDLKRWVADEPIEARPPSFVYRTSKILRKHRSKAAIAIVVLCASILSAIGFGYGLSQRNASIDRQKLDADRNQQIQKLADIEADRNRSLRYGNALIAANESFRSGRRATTIELLAECPEDKRGIEWQWMNYLAADRTESLFEGSDEHHQNAIAFHESEHRLFSGGDDGMLHMWNSDTNQEMQSWRITDDPIVAMHFINGTMQLLIATKKGEVLQWDISSGSAISRSKSITASLITTLAATHQKESDKYSVGCDDGSIFVWSNTLDSESVRFENKSQTVLGAMQTLQFNHDGDQLLAAGKGGVTLYDSDQGSVLQSYGQDYQSYGSIFAHELGCIAAYGPPVVIVNAKSLDKPRYIDVPATGIWAGTYVVSDTSLILATEDQCLRSVDLASERQSTLGYYNSGTVVRVTAADDGHAIAIIDGEGSLRLLKRDSYSSPKSLKAFDGEIASIAAVRSNEIYCLSEQGELIVWNAQNETELWRKSAHTYQGFNLAFDARRSRLVSNGLDRKLVEWSTKSTDAAATIDISLGARYTALHPDGVHFAAPMPSDTSKAVAEGLDINECKDSNLALWNLDTGKIERCFTGLTNWAMRLRFSNDGKLLAAATISDGPVIWKLDRAEAIRFPNEKLPQVDDVAFSNDQQYLFSAYHNGQVYVWNIASQTLERKMVCHGDQIARLQVTADGSRIVTASVNDHVLRIWDWKTGQQVAQLDSGVSGVCDFIFIDDESSLLIAGRDGRLTCLKIR
jgi:eukaryotic-like serine/threonine-protein kinase